MTQVILVVQNSHYVMEELSVSFEYYVYGGPCFQTKTKREKGMSRETKMRFKVFQHHQKIRHPDLIVYQLKKDNVCCHVLHKV